jgi:hypothetical protein
MWSTCTVVGGVLVALLSATSAMAQPVSESPSAASIKSLTTATRDSKDASRDAPKDVAKDGVVKAAAPKDAAVSTAVPRQRRPVLRCWQEGKLVFEGSGLTPVVQGQAAIELRHAAGTALQVFDLKNGLCLLDHGND